MPLHPRLKADSAPKDHLSSHVVIAITRMANLIKRYDKRELWGSEMLYHILGTFLALTGPEKGSVLEYFRNCGNWKPVQSHSKGPENAKGNISTEEKPKGADESGGESR